MSVSTSSATTDRRAGLAQVVPFMLILVLGVASACWLTSWGLPCPRGDDAFYKSPAAELAQTGRLASPCAIGFLPQAAAVFAAYPPVFQWVLGAWYVVFGVSLYSSLAFNYTVHLLGTLAVMEVCRRLLRRSGDVPAFAAAALVLAVGAIQWGNLAYFDRQEETALLFVWLEVLLLRAGGPRSGIVRSLLSGVMVGLAALTSPWVGILGAMIVAFRALLAAAGNDRHGFFPATRCRREGSGFRVQGSVSRGRRKPKVLNPEPRTLNPWVFAGLHLAIAASAAAAVAAVWVAATEWRHPGAIHDQLFSTLGFLQQTQGSAPLGERLALFFSYTLRYNLPQTPVVALTLVLFPAAIAAVGWRRVAPTAGALFMAGTLGIAAVALLRPIAYTYLGAAQIVLLPCLAPAVACGLRRRLPWTGWAFAAVAVCALFAQRDVVRLGRCAVELPQGERAEVVFDRLTTIVPPGELVAVRSLHWHAFQGRNPWREAYFSALLDSQEVRRCRWLVLPPKVRPDYLDGFELVEEVPSNAPRYRTYAYSLWRRRES